MSQAPSKLLCQKSLSFSSGSNQAKILSNRCRTNHLLGADSDSPHLREFVVHPIQSSRQAKQYPVVTTCQTLSIESNIWIHLTTHDSIPEINPHTPSTRASICKQLHLKVWQTLHLGRSHTFKQWRCDELRQTWTRIHHHLEPVKKI